MLPPSYLHNVISYTGETTSLYWIGAQVPKIDDMVCGSISGVRWKNPNRRNYHFSLSTSSGMKFYSVKDWSQLVTEKGDIDNNYLLTWGTILKAIFLVSDEGWEMSW